MGNLDDLVNESIDLCKKVRSKNMKKKNEGKKVVQPPEVVAFRTEDAGTTRVFCVGCAKKQDLFENKDLRPLTAMELTNLVKALHLANADCFHCSEPCIQ